MRLKLLQRRSDIVRLLQDDKKFYQLELVNRETNFNKVFNASPNVGVINPLIKVGPPELLDRTASHGGPKHPDAVFDCRAETMTLTMTLTPSHPTSLSHRSSGAEASHQKLITHDHETPERSQGVKAKPSRKSGCSQRSFSQSSESV